MNPRSRSLDLLVFVVGVGILGAEIAAARLLAPWFGASTIVWANTIAICLVALSVGYAVGGRLADRDPTPTGLARIVLIASVLIAIVPFISGPFLRQAVNAVEDLSVATFLGSLLGVGALVALPLTLLGMVSPYAVRLSVDKVEDAGRVAGRLSAIATVGSLTGTFLAALLLIPVVGTRRTFLIFAAAMALAAVANLGRYRIPAAGVPAVILVLIAFPAGTVKATGSGTVIWEAETEYQYARVIEDASGIRRLELNEGHAIHSRYEPGEYLSGSYWDEGTVSVLAARTSPADSVAILGNAAGTVARSIGHFFPQTRIEGVELDGEITEVGRELFDMNAPRLTTHTADARPWLEATEDRFDVIMMDAYRQPYIPFYLTSREFFELARERLRPGGIVMVNVGQPEGSTRLEKVLSATLRAAFGEDAVWRNPAGDTNTLLIASEDGTDPGQRLADAAADADPQIAAIARATVRRLEPALRGGRVYTDDIAPVEWLIDASLADVAR